MNRKKLLVLAVLFFYGNNVFAHNKKQEKSKDLFEEKKINFIVNAISFCWILHYLEEAKNPEGVFEIYEGYTKKENFHRSLWRHALLLFFKSIHPLRSLSDKYIDFRNFQLTCNLWKWAMMDFGYLENLSGSNHEPHSGVDKFRSPLTFGFVGGALQLAYEKDLLEDFKNILNASYTIRPVLFFKNYESNESLDLRIHKNILHLKELIYLNVVKMNKKKISCFNEIFKTQISHIINRSFFLDSFFPKSLLVTYLKIIKNIENSFLSLPRRSLHLDKK